jgi:MFS family permease
MAKAGLAFLPTTLVNFAAAMAVPRLTRRWGNPTVLVTGLTVSVIGMAWLSRLSAHTDYITGIALPMALIGAGQGGALAPLTSAGIAGVAPEDAGAAGGVTNVFHQIGGSLGLAILVAVFAAAGSSTLHGPELLAHRISASLTIGAGFLGLALLISLAVRPRRRPATATERTGRRHLVARAAPGASAEPDSRECAKSHRPAARSTLAKRGKRPCGRVHSRT